ncbi:exonuclease SbcCD subunit D [Ruminococcus sp. AF41-9]|nr:exonuclease SbcCD subunit D [Ruminococcus sp. AF41-9]
MKFAHIADLHIGKRVHDFSMLEDQRYILEEMLRIFDEEKVDGVLIAGDVYDKTVPSAEAVQVFDDFITKLAKMEMPIYMISGNHDSAERLAFGAQLFENDGVYISPVYEGEVKKVEVEDVYGTVNIWLLPFLKPATVRHALQREDINTYEEGIVAALQGCEIDTEQRNILVAHQFVTGADRSDSEETSVGGLDNVSAEVFEDFDYVALGHIHRAQKMGRETLRYSGTPLKYSFSEADHKKSVTILELLEKGRVEIHVVPLVPRRDMRKMRGTYMEVTAKDAYTEENKMDYLQITLTDEEDVPGALQKLRTVYSNLMRLEYDNARTRENREVQAVEAQEQKSELELFEEFYELLNNESMKDEQVEFVEKLIQDLKEVRV